MKLKTINLHLCGKKSTQTICPHTFFLHILKKHLKIYLAISINITLSCFCLEEKARKS